MKKTDSRLRFRARSVIDLPRLRLRSPLGMALIAAPMFAVLGAFAIAPQTPVHAPKMEATPLVLDIAAMGNEGVYSRSERVSRGDTIDALLVRLAIRDDAARNFIHANPAARGMSKLAPGALIHARIDDTGLIQELRFQSSPTEETLIARAEGELTSVVQPLTLTTRLETRTGLIGNSLFASLDKADVPDSYARQLIDIFAGDIDFHRGLKRGDRFSLTYEVQVDDYGSEVKQGRLLSATFENGGEEHRAIAFTLPDGKTEYFSPEGESLKRAFLKNPVEFSRISSGFTTARFHPVLQTMRAHKGVDYAAPTGSKVMATADGKVEFVGVQGGYGNVIIIRHDKSYSTVYGHLNGFAKGIRRGSTVEQGQIIGFVGMTGLASGPHLHYEFKINNQQIDPLSAKVPLATALNSLQQSAFKEQLAQLDQQTALQSAPSASASFE